MSSPVRPSTAACRVSTTEVNRTLTSTLEAEQPVERSIENAEERVDLNSATRFTEAVIEAAKN